MESPPAPGPDSWSCEIAIAVATGVVTAALPVHRWPRGARWAMHATTGLTTGAAAAWILRRPESRASEEPESDDGSSRTPLDPGATAAIATGIGLLMFGTSVAGASVDRAAEHALSARGVRRPRWWIGAAAALATVAMNSAERRWQD